MGNYEDEDDVEVATLEEQPVITDAQIRADIEDRRTFIGGSDAPVILGISPWKTPYELWQEKTGKVEPPNLDEIELIMAGKLLEETIAKLYMWKYGIKVRRVNERIISKDTSYPAVAQVDRRIQGRRCVLEIKNTSEYQRDKWGEEMTSEIPVYYYAQVEHQEMVLGWDKGEACALIGGNKVRRYIVNRDQAFIDSLYEAEFKFWQLVKQDIPPEPTSIDEANLEWTDPKEAAVTGEELAGHIAAFCELQSTQIKECEHKRDLGKMLLMKAMQNLGDTLKVGGKPICTWKKQTTKRFDYEAFAAANPDMAKWYTTETTSRVFRFGKAGKEFTRNDEAALVALEPYLEIPAPADEGEEN